MQMTPHYSQLLARQQTDLLLLPPLPGTWLGFSSGAITACMILNPNQAKALVVSRSRAVNPPHGDLVLSVVSIRASSNLDILGVKFDSKLTFENDVRGIVSPGLSKNWYFFVLRCYLLFTSQSLSIVLRCGVSY